MIGCLFVIKALINCCITICYGKTHLDGGILVVFLSLITMCCGKKFGNPPVIINTEQQQPFQNYQYYSSYQQQQMSLYVSLPEEQILPSAPPFEELPNHSPPPPYSVDTP